jgi:hypothetical protein
MTATGHRKLLRPLAISAVAIGCVVFWGLAVIESADARPGGGGGRGGGARMNVGGGFNGPRSMSRPAPSRPSAGQRPATPPQRPSAAPQPLPPVSGVGGGGDRLRSPTQPKADTRPAKPDQKPRPEQPICKGGNCVTNPPNRPDRPPYNPDYPDYYPPSWGYYPGYWPPPYPAYDDDYPPPPPPAAALPPGTIAGTIPADCKSVGVGDITYLLCGATWYAPRFSGNQLVYVVVSPPT